MPDSDAMPDMTWADLRYSREHAASDSPPRLGMPDIGAWAAYERHRTARTLTGNTTTWRSLTEMPPDAAAHAPGVEQIPRRQAAAEAEAKGLVLVTAPRFWWWSVDMPTDPDALRPWDWHPPGYDPGETAPMVVMAAATLAAPAPEPKYADAYALHARLGDGGCETCAKVDGRPWVRARYVWTGPNGYDTWLCEGCCTAWRGIKALDMGPKRVIDLGAAPGAADVIATIHLDTVDTHQLAQALVDADTGLTDAQRRHAVWVAGMAAPPRLAAIGMDPDTDTESIVRIDGSGFHVLGRPVVVTERYTDDRVELWGERPPWARCADENASAGSRTGWKVDENGMYTVGLNGWPSNG